MSNVTISPNMSLPIPIVGQDPGPDYASNGLNASFTIIDGHNHSAGSGVPINPNGININSDLAMNNNNLTLLNSVEYAGAISTTPTILTSYTDGTDFFWKDSSGNNIQLTKAGGPNAGTGNITGLPSTPTGGAGISWVNSQNTFQFLQDSGIVGANIDAGSVVFRYPGSFPSPSGNFISVQAPASLSSGYSLTWPSLPGTTEVMTLDTSGVMGTQTYDQIGQNMTSVGANAIRTSTTKTTGTTVGIGGVAVSTSSGSFNTNSATAVDVTNLSLTITTSGKPVMLLLGSDPAANGTVRVDDNTGGIPQASLILVNTTNSTNYQTLISAASGTAVSRIGIPPSSYSQLDMTVNGIAGTYTYKVQALVSNPATTTVQVSSAIFMAYELT